MLSLGRDKRPIQGITKMGVYPCSDQSVINERVTALSVHALYVRHQVCEL